MAEMDVRVVKDSEGRELELKRLTMLEEFDLIEAAGPASDVPRWMIMATICAVVRSIAGTPYSFPRTKEQIRAHVARVGSAGYNAVTEFLTLEIAAMGGVEALDENQAKN